MSTAASLAALDEYDFELPGERIAQQPCAERDGARMLVMRRFAQAEQADGLQDAAIRSLPDFLAPGDLVVVNTTRVLAARLRGRKASGGGAEALLLAALGDGRYRALLKTSRRQRPGLELRFEREGHSASASLVETCEGGECILRFDAGVDPYALGEAPLPPYIRRGAGRESDEVQNKLDAERYQTVFASVPGAVAAPTAGLHLTPELLADLEARGVARAELVLHVGLGTFKPLEAEQLASGRLHRERYELPEATVGAIDATRARGGRVVAIGTTTTRVLEACARPWLPVGADPGEALRAGAARGASGLRPGAGETDLFLRPGDPFHVVDALLTNFHLPRSSLLMLVAAFAGRERILAAYRTAVERAYRFYSYGDAMLIH